MGRMLILIGSPRAPRSNSRQYAALFAKGCPMETETVLLTGRNHLEICRAIAGCTDVLLVFPLYADSLPTPLLAFLKTLERQAIPSKPTISVLINCGFYEPAQNDTALAILRCFCAQSGYPFGASLKIGGGEAILASPFRPLVQAKLRRLAAAIVHHTGEVLSVTMPIPRRWFLLASTRYWTAYGRRYGVTPAEMATMEIEGGGDASRRGR